ncbi:PREDICTED: 39S ribosomal protein L37, mitochondrial [Ceratosolen solmsi marchali]|uniref:Large ribosomal subunit protein mL37 n=1 Tax=Ceratosolen solmsi marchali TaxID=326594 RepID=A0AAJ6YTN3_9HYME|nr:PREDICTED: 39S ribosomal protein L37, mitochondrial [Ceratosolen solmsi marchali]
MKLSQFLCKHHIGRQIRQLWYIQGKKKPLDFNTESKLTSQGVHIEDALEVTNNLRKLNIKVCNFSDQVAPIKVDTHPYFNNEPCFLYEDNDLLVKGLTQAQKITNTIVFDTLPESIESITQDLSDKTNDSVKRIIQSSIIFDAHQQLLPKLKDPDRPAFNFPRKFGITNNRKTSNLNKKFIQLCNCLSGSNIGNSRSIMDDAFLCVPFDKDFHKFKFSLTIDIMLMSKNILRPVRKLDTEYESMTLPTIYPLQYLIGLTKSQIYEFKNLYPFISEYNKKYIHTIFIYYDSTKVKNLTELEIEETQIFGRALIKAFTAAASTARQRYGANVKTLPEPITVQCIHTDSKAYYFSVYQLNTLDINGEKGIKNYCWALPKLNLYDLADYVQGIPTLEGYNPDVFKRILAFYKNQ